MTCIDEENSYTNADDVPAWPGALAAGDYRIGKRYKAKRPAGKRRQRKHRAFCSHFYYRKAMLFTFTESYSKPVTNFFKFWVDHLASMKVPAHMATQGRL